MRCINPPPPWWTGIKLVCQVCGAPTVLEEKDIPVKIVQWHMEKPCHIEFGPCPRCKYNLIWNKFKAGKE